MTARFSYKLPGAGMTNDIISMLRYGKGDYQEIITNGAMAYE